MHGASRLVSTSNRVSCDSYYTGIWHLHRRVQDIRKNSSTDICRQWRNRFITIAIAPYPFFQFLHKSDAPIQTYSGSVFHETSKIRVDCFTCSPSSTPRSSPDSLCHSVLSNEHSASCEAEHNTTWSKPLQTKHDNTHNLAGAVHYKLCTDRQSKIDEHVRRKQDSTI